MSPCLTGPSYGVVKVDPNTGAVLDKFGPRGNALGIAVNPVADPVTHSNHLVYVGRDCSSTVYGMSCTLYDIDPHPALGTPTATIFSAFDPFVDVGYVDGLYFDPSGAFVFLDNRFPSERLTVLRKTSSITAAFAQHVDVSSEPAGIGFHAKFIATNNTDGTMTR